MGKEATRVRRRERKNIASGIAHVNFSGSSLCHPFGSIDRPIDLPSDHRRWRPRISPRPSKFQNNRKAAPAARDQISNAPALARTATIVRDRRHGADRRHGKARRLQRTERRFTARTRAGHFHFQRAHAVFLRLLGNVFGRDLRGIGGRLARALEAHRSGRRPGDGVALRVGDGDGGVVERRIHMRDAGCTVLAFAAAYAGGFLAHSKTFPVISNAAVMPAATPKNVSSEWRAANGNYSPPPVRYSQTYFFLPAIDLAGPLRVRALVWVRLPRTGRPRRCRSPR